MNLVSIYYYYQRHWSNIVLINLITPHKQLHRHGGRSHVKAFFRFINGAWHVLHWRRYDTNYPQTDSHTHTHNARMISQIQLNVCHLFLYSYKMYFFIRFVGSVCVVIAAVCHQSPAPVCVCWTVNTYPNKPNDTETDELWLMEEGKKCKCAKHFPIFPLVRNYRWTAPSCHLPYVFACSVNDVVVVVDVNRSVSVVGWRNMYFLCTCDVSSNNNIDTIVIIYRITNRPINLTSDLVYQKAGPHNPGMTTLPLGFNQNDSIRPI